jgi:hypothetical protein
MKEISLPETLGEAQSQWREDQDAEDITGPEEEG